MKTERKTKAQLIQELDDLNRRIHELETKEVEYKQIAESLKESEERDRTAIEYSNDGFAIVHQRKLLFVNKKFLEIFGFDREEEVLGHSADIIVHPDDLNRVLEIGLAREKGEATPQRYDFKVIRKDGLQRYIEVSASRTVYQGKPVTLAYLRDITEHKQTEKLLSQAEERYHTIVENAIDGIFQITSQGKILTANTALAHILGYESTQELTENVTDLGQQFYTDLEDRGEFIRLLAERGRVEGLETQAVRKDGRKIWISMNVREVFDRAGGVYHYEGTVEDITLRKEAEAELLREKYFIDSAIEGLPGIFYLFDEDRHFLKWNRNFETVTGYSTEEISEMSPLDLFTGEEKPLVSDRIWEVFIHGQAQVEAQLVSKKGRKVPYLLTGLRFFSEERIFLIGMGIDITEREEAEQELRQTLEKLRKAMAGIIQAMALTVETRDPYTAGHQRRVAELARAIAQEMGLPEDQMDGLRMAGIVHDLGKISIPTEILIKPTQLSDIEFKLIKVHPQTSYDILKDIDFPWPLAEIVLQHHERINGSGYPLGLLEKDIYLEARILAVADVVEAIASHRPYRPAFGIDVALEEIEKNKGALYDPKAVEVCLRLFREKGFKFE